MRVNKRRRGGIAIELLFVLPVLLAVLLASVEFSLWLTAQQQVALAGREGARVASTGGTEEEIQNAVRLVLGEPRYDRSTVTVTITDELGNPLTSGDPVAVVVQLPVRYVVPDLLAFIGLSIRNQVLVNQTVMRKE
ncbi:MAG: TadE/TadG family type IV pilus assembly protein [Gemmataceae bacterium]